LESRENVVVAHDDLDIPVGSFKISYGKNSGGHNGVESIIGVLKTNNFVRLRIGIAPNNEDGQGRTSIQEDTANFVLKNFSSEETGVMDKTIEKASDALKTIILEGRMVAMEKFN
jgi:peptidyl-tRNA hydrolase, PTH1 family